MWASRSKWPKPPTPSTPTPTRSSLLKGKEGAGCDEPTPTPPPPPPPLPHPYSSTLPRNPMPPLGRKNGEGGEEIGQGERDEHREVTGQGRPRSPKTVQSAEGGEGKDKRERIVVVVRSPCQENYPAHAHPSAHKSVLESANPAWTRRVHLDAPGQRHGQQPVSAPTGLPAPNRPPTVVQPLASASHPKRSPGGGSSWVAAVGVVVCTRSVSLTPVRRADPPSRQHKVVIFDSTECSSFAEGIVTTSTLSHPDGYGHVWNAPEAEV